MTGTSFDVNIVKILKAPSAGQSLDMPESVSPPENRPHIGVGERLTAFRQALGYAPIDMCRSMNVRQNTYSQWESGKSRINLDDAIRLCDRFGLTLDYLYRDDISGVRSDIAARIIGRTGPGLPTRDEKFAATV